MPLEMEQDLVVPRATLCRIVELAGRAPSVHNTQPWRWRADRAVLELYADPARRLVHSDPHGRNLVISCGAALHHAGVAAAAMGWVATAERPADPELPDLLARIRFRPLRAPGDDLRPAILSRCTDRRRFTSWPVPVERLTSLAAAAEAVGAHALPVVGRSRRFHAELLINRAVDLQGRDRDAQREQESWTDHSDEDGIPSGVLPQPHDLVPHRRSRFSEGLLDDLRDREVEASDGLIFLVDADDDVDAWLTAGQGLSALWLAATVSGMSVVPLSQVVEYRETRAALQDKVTDGHFPLIVARIGWQAIGRRDLPRTPRRPLEEILDES